MGAATQLGQQAKSRQKLNQKNSWNWLVILMLTTVWQIFNKQTQWPETEIMRICWNFLGKNSWNHIMSILFLAGLVYLEPLCAIGMTGKNVVLPRFGGYKSKPIWCFIRPTINLGPAKLRFMVGSLYGMPKWKFLAVLAWAPP